MGCADICLSMDYDGCNEFYAEKVVKARKPHRCCECGDEIGVGSLYERASGKSDGDFFAVNTCLACREIRAAFCCGSWLFGELWESIYEEMFPAWQRVGPWDCLDKLKTPEAVAKVNAEFAAWCGDNDYDDPAREEQTDG